MTEVAFSALIVDSNGVVAHPAAQWDFCDARNPLANLGPDDPSCLQPGSSMATPTSGSDASVAPPALTPFGAGTTASGVIPSDACSQFGPNPPAPPPPLPGQPPQPPGRPVDPDPTGGYYVPVSFFVLDPTQAAPISTIYPSRLSCGFAAVDPVSAGELNARYHLNANPMVASLTLAGGAPLQPDTMMGAVNPVTAGQKLQLEVAWPGCPTTDVCPDNVCGADESTTSCPADCKTPPTATEGCAGAERYVNFDIASETVVDQREGMHVAWYATGGTFDADRTGRDGTDMTTTSDNGWQAPAAAGPVHLWIVLADDRGGVAWAGYALSTSSNGRSFQHAR